VAPPPFTLEIPDGWVGGHGPVAYIEALVGYSRAHPECKNLAMERLRNTPTDEEFAYAATEVCNGDAMLMVTESDVPPELAVARALELYVHGNLEDLASREDLLGEPTATSVDIAGDGGRVIRWSWNEGASPSSFALYAIASRGRLWVLTFRSDAASAPANEPVFLAIASSFRPTEPAVENDPTQVARSCLERAMAHTQQGEYNLAIAESTRAVELDPMLALAFIDRGYALTKQGELDLAIADLTNAIELDPTLKSAFHNRGMAYHQQGQLDLAIADLTRAIELQPDFAFAYPDRAQMLLEQGDDSAALADAEKAIELEPRLAPGYYARGLVLAQRGRDDRALADYSKAIELDPDDGDAIWERSGLYMRHKDGEAALADIGRLFEFTPESALLYARRGAAKAIGGDRAGALGDFDRARAMTTDPEDLSLIDEEQREVGL
jgi:tetratricopeptide (TPR) repeat protein